MSTRPATTRKNAVDECQSHKVQCYPKFLGLLLGLAVALGFTTGVRTEEAVPSPAGTYVTYATGEYLLQGRLCKPEGADPFPAVVYNHGGFDKIGGAPDETCTALAKAGFVGFSPIRRPTRAIVGHPQDVATAIDYVAALPYVDIARIGLIGFSRGASLTLVVAARRKGLKAVVIMGTAGIEGRMNIDLAGITAPVFVLVAKNDTGSRYTAGNNTVTSSDELVAKLKQAGRDVTYTVYPPYGRDGHLMFYEIGAYWTDVVEFLKKHL